MQIKQIYKQIDRHDVISFDIFDTLLLRPFMRPQDVFTLLEVKENAPGFAALRAGAEKRIQDKTGKKTATYDEIYAEMPPQFAFLQAKEWDLESKTIYAHPVMKNIYNYARKKSKRIFFTSDMYLSSAQLKFLLEKNGFYDAENIFISAEQGAAKHTGTLFPHIAKLLNVNPQDVLHIGDNPYSDGECARAAGYDYCQVPRAEELFFHRYPQFFRFWQNNQNSLTASIILGILIKKHLISDGDWADYWRYFGYAWGGPVCLGLAQFVLKRTLEEKMEEVIFVARDGYTIEKIFALLAPHGLKHNYIYAPRSVNLLSRLDNSGEKPWTDKAGSILRMAQKLCPELARLCPTIPQGQKEKTELLQKHLPLLQPMARRIRDAYTAYLSRFSFQTDRIAIFDVSATTFNSYRLLKDFLNDKKILGLYWLAYADEKLEIWYDIYQKNCTDTFHNYEMLEWIVTAPELPVMYIDENGLPVRIPSDREALRARLYQTVSGAEIDFAKEALDTFGRFLPEFECNTLIRLVNTLTRYPSKRDYRNFRKIQHGKSEDHTVYSALLKQPPFFSKHGAFNRWRYLALQHVTWGSKRLHYQNKLNQYK